MEIPTAEEPIVVIKSEPPGINNVEDVDVSSIEASSEPAVRRSGRQRKPPIRGVEPLTNSYQPRKRAFKIIGAKSTPSVVLQKRQPIDPPLSDVPQIFLPPFRLVDLNVLAFKLWCTSCSQPLSLRDCVEEYHTFYKSVLKIGCHKCYQIIQVPLSLISESGNMSAYGKSSLNLEEKKQMEKCSVANYSVLESSRTNLEVEGTLQDSEPLEPCPSVPEEMTEQQAKQVDERQQEGKENETDNTKKSGHMSHEAGSTFEVPRKKSRKQSIQVLQDEIVSAWNSMVPLQEDITFSDSDSIDNNELDGNVEHGSTAGDAEGDLIDDSSENDSEKQHDESDEWEPDKESDDDEDSGDDLDSDLGGDEMARELNKTKREIKENCIYCPLEFDDVFSAIRHMTESHPDFLKKKCGMCKKKFKQTSKFRMHIRTHRKSLKNMFCEVCGKFMTKSAYEQHVSTHTEEKQYECEICSLKLKSERSLRNHMGVHMNYKCDFCNKPIRVKTRLIEHIKIHVDNKTYDCDICGAQFMHNDNMKTHRKNNHTFVCLVCFKSFNCHPKKVEKHAKKEHSAEDIASNSINGKPYERVTRFQCKTCYMYLATKQSLQFHEKTHNKDDKPQGRSRTKKGKSQKSDET